MNWIRPKYNKSQVKNAGEVLTKKNPYLLEELEDRKKYRLALAVLNNWRASHSFPLNTFQVRLRTQTQQIDQTALIAQRLKRTPSIINKLKRFKRMNLSRMQDIGGCRAILSDTKKVKELRNFYIKQPAKHIFVKEDDYISNPKSSGYRSIHLVYKYHSNRNNVYNGLLIEIQLRSKIQHAWATAVETAGTFLASHLKSEEGPKEWLSLFKYISSGFAILENTNIVPNTIENPEHLQRIITEKLHLLKFRETLEGYNAALFHIDRHVKENDYYLMILRPLKKTIKIISYNKKFLKEATKEYLKREQAVRNEPGSEVVLVSSGTIRSLKQAYPNYFLDTRQFFKYLDRFLNI